MFERLCCASFLLGLNSSTTDNSELVEEEEMQHDKIDCALNITQSLSNYELEMKAVESELSSLQQSMYGQACILRNYLLL